MKNEPKTWSLHLFVAGKSERSRRSIAQLNTLVENHCGEGADITITDLIDEPDEATERDILAIPTLIRESPEPFLRVIGDLSDTARVWSLISR